ncbi:MAG: CBS domain-containing protein [Lachnospiraceae bacterium]|nr:CBS domain-containing protein [Lachnospiraceae bacterium]
MNILFFITPKSEVACVYEDDSLRQALERMEYHQYASVPMLRRDGKYVGTLTEGDLLWGIKNQYNLNLREAESMPVTTISRRMDYLPVNGKSDMEGLVDKALNQNFVPVVDDRGYFIGIITRKDIIRYFYEKKMPGHMPLQLQG